MGKFDGILLCSDLDGTLLKDDKTISSENYDAIEYFKANGGIFTIMTGRMSYALSTVLDKVTPNAPIGFGNGLGIYDTTTKSRLYSVNLDNSALKVAEYVFENYPDMGIELTTHDGIYCISTSDATIAHLGHDNLPLVKTTFEDFSKPLAKILFTNEPERIDELISDLKNFKYAEQFQLLRSDGKYYEVLPKNIGKHTLLKKLTEILGKDLKKTIAIGDNDNDSSMLSLADIGVAVSNASKAAKNAANMITVSNEEHAIAELIYILDNKS